MKKAKLALISAALAVASISVATASPVSVGVNVGTLGIAPQIGVVLSPNVLDLRAQFGFLNYSHSMTSSDMDYDGHLNLRSIGLLADVHPFEGRFRLTGGVILNRNKFDLTGMPHAGTTYTSNGTSYTAQAGDEVDASVDFRKVAPYAGIGWSNDDNSAGFHLTADFGVMFQGQPNAKVTATTADPNAQSQATAWANSAQDQLNTDLKKFRFYPVVQVGAIYRF